MIACVCVVMLALSAMAITDDSMTLLSPFPLLVTAAWIVVVGGHTSASNADVAKLQASLVIPLLFVAWNLPLIRGATAIPSRSKWAALALALLSGAYFALVAKYGVIFQGSAHTYGVIAINASICATLSVLHVLNRRRATFASNLLFHAVLFSWLGTYAFPFLGEGP